MNKALQQYLTLFEEHRDLIDKNAPHAMNRLRDEAYESLVKFGLPAKGSENYEQTDLESILAPDFGLNLARVPLGVNVSETFKCGVPHLSSALFFLLNDQWGESSGARKVLPEGVEIGPLSKYLHSDPEAAERYGRLADIANPISALNTLLVQEGMYLRVRKGVKLSKPIQLVNILDNAMSLMAVRRLLIIMEEESEAQILMCDHTASAGLPMCSVMVSEIYAGRNARLDVYDMEESNPDTRRLSALYLSQEENSDVLIDGIILHNGVTRNEYHCAFAAPHSQLRLYGLGIEDRSRVLDNFSYINHAFGECHTEELFKYILDEEAKGAFTGTIFVAPGASKTEAYQSNRNLVGSDRARMYSKPQLEIYNDDVKCSHGSATGRLDSTQLFYLRSRGIDKNEAVLLLKQAFMADVIDGIRLQMLRDRVHTLVARRIAGEDTACGDCDICN